jgi:hypothetical protein
MTGEPLLFCYLHGLYDLQRSGAAGERVVHFEPALSQRSFAWLAILAAFWGAGETAFALWASIAMVQAARFSGKQADR